MLNEDYKDMLLALSDEKVRYMLVGAYALAAHGYPRATMDMDIWVMSSGILGDVAPTVLEVLGLPSVQKDERREHSGTIKQDIHLFSILTI